MERYDPSLGQWIAVAAMSSIRSDTGFCVVAGEIYVTDGYGGADNSRLASVEKHLPSTDTWSATTPLPLARSSHTAVAVGPAMYVLGGVVGDIGRKKASVLKFD
jgi:N-acetylneuraminic acid mutarotase